MLRDQPDLHAHCPLGLAGPASCHLSGPHSWTQHALSSEAPDRGSCCLGTRGIRHRKPVGCKHIAGWTRGLGPVCPQNRKCRGAGRLVSFKDIMSSSRLPPLRTEVGGDHSPWWRGSSLYLRPGGWEMPPGTQTAHLTRGPSHFSWHTQGQGHQLGPVSPVLSMKSPACEHTRTSTGAIAGRL